ncbi:MAG: TonB-dependent receptor [Prevotellaceae bacterium]|nr:TonB-dependent receptor [Prevotellaceae bacterium]
MTGTVVDATGEAIIGASVVVKGSTQATMSDVNGSFMIAVANNSAVLQVSFLGYVTQEVSVASAVNGRLTITLAEDMKALEEVTIVAFGTQKKESVVASITTINPAELKIPSSNLTTALAGNMAGIIAYQRSGEPGRDNADFFVRGITTFGANTNPLILIDNVELTTTDLARLQPDDIASFSIMKDATATALYGARGANGVILVTTKRGVDGPAKIFVRLENSISAPTSTAQFTDPVTYMKMHNEAVLTRNPLGELPFSQDKIENTMNPAYSPYIYPANDWYGMLFKDYAMNQRANVSVTGGSKVARYYVSGAFTQDNGILNVDKRNSFNNNIDFKNYNLRANVDVNITKTTELSVRLTGNFDDYTGPTGGGEEVYKMAVRSSPVLFPAYYPVDEDFKYVKHIMFGNVAGIYTNPYAEMVRGYQDRSRSQMLAQVELRQGLDFITKGLSIRSMMNISRLAEHSAVRQYKPYWYRMLGNYDSFTGEYHLARINEDGTEYLDYTDKDPSILSTMYTETALNYANTFGKHSISALAVLTTRQELAAFQGTVQLSLPSRNAGLAGRTTYSYDSRYFVEFNFGYNGSERFAANHRWGFFPSAGAGWMISNEKFWENLKPVVSNLKLRYSYGLVGNDQIGDLNDRFLYISRITMDDTEHPELAAHFGENLEQVTNRIVMNSYASDDITWETSTMQNFAIELGLWNKVNVIAEYFTEYRNNILMSRAAIPSTMGLEAPVRANVGEASAHGVDIQMDYQQSWNKNFWTAARMNFTYSTSRYEVYEEPEYNEYWRSHVGRSLGQNYGYIAERLFMDDFEAINSPPQLFGGQYGGGDIKYTDVNRDGQITSADMVPIGYPTSPEIIYGFGLSAGYKGFDVSLFFQGLGNESFWISLVDDPNAGTISTAPFQAQTQLLQAYADSHWSEEHQDMYAIWPRLSATLNANNTQASTWFMRNGSFLRLKQAEIGYTISGKWQQKLHLDQLRVYISGTNLLMFSKFKLWDAEMAGFGLGYPIQRVFNIGVNMTFN